MIINIIVIVIALLAVLLVKAKEGAKLKNEIKKVASDYEKEMNSKLLLQNEEIVKALTPVLDNVEFVRSTKGGLVFLDENEEPLTLTTNSLTKINQSVKEVDGEIYVNDFVYKVSHNQPETRTPVLKEELTSLNDLPSEPVTSLKPKSTANKGENVLAVSPNGEVKLIDDVRRIPKSKGEKNPIKTVRFAVSKQEINSTLTDISNYLTPLPERSKGERKVELKISVPVDTANNGSLTLQVADEQLERIIETSDLKKKREIINGEAYFTFDFNINTPGFSIVAVRPLLRNNNTYRTFNIENYLYDDNGVPHWLCKVED